MNLCATGHDEVCFEGRKCPFCAYTTTSQAALEKALGEIRSLQDALIDQETVVGELKAQLDDLLKPCLEAANGVTKQ